VVLRDFMSGPLGVESGKIRDSCPETCLPTRKPPGKRRLVMIDSIVAVLVRSARERMEQVRGDDLIQLEKAIYQGERLLAMLSRPDHDRTTANRELRQFLLLLESGGMLRDD
jgi:hypothetical protein